MGFRFAIESNRLVSTEPGQWTPVVKREIPDEGPVVWLKHFGSVKLFRTRLTNQLRHYIVYLTDTTQVITFDQKAFRRQHDWHWQVEQYHRIIKPVCNIESFPVRGKVPILNHLFAALCSYVHLPRWRVADVSRHAYRLQKDLFKEVVATFINSGLLGKEYLNPKFRTVVKA